MQTTLEGRHIDVAFKTLRLFLLQHEKDSANIEYRPLLGTQAIVEASTVREVTTTCKTKTHCRCSKHQRETRLRTKLRINSPSQQNTVYEKRSVTGGGEKRWRWGTAFCWKPSSHLTPLRASYQEDSERPRGVDEFSDNKLQKKWGLGGEVRCNESDMGFCGDSFPAVK